MNVKTQRDAQTIGHFTRTNCHSCSKRKGTNVLCITEINGSLNARLLPDQLDNFVLVIYDPSRLYDYGTLPDHESDSQKFNCFIMLSKCLSGSENMQKHNNVSNVMAFQRFTNCLVIALNVLISSFGTKFVQFTILRLTVFKHILSVLKSYVWFIENLMHNKHILSKTKTINYFLSCICDALLGIVIIHLISSTFASSNELFSFLSSICHVNKFIHFIQRFN